MQMYSMVRLRKDFKTVFYSLLRDSLLVDTNDFFIPPGVHGNSLDESANVSRQISRFVKESWPTRQRLFEKPLHLFEKALSSF